MDRVVAAYAYSFIGRVPFLDGIAVFFAAYMPYLFVVAFVAMLFTKGFFGADAPLAQKKQRLHFILKTILAVLLAWGIITPFIHYAYGRARPFAAFGWTPLIAHEASPSFPSGHAVFFFALAASAWRANKKWGKWFLIAASLNAVARVYALVHFPTDVIFGALLAIGVVFLVDRLMPSS